MFSAVIVCGGKSTRMAGKDKMKLLLDGIPVWEMTLRVFHGCSAVDEIVIAASEQLLPEIRGKMMCYPKLKVAVKGGNSRQASALAGVSAVSGHADYIAVHDGARPFVTKELIERVLADAVRVGAAAPAVPVKDTIKIKGTDGCVSSTPDRSVLFACQTPQIFRADLYRSAADRAQAEGADYTDDCQMIEAAGGKVFLSEGMYENVKITTPDDYARALAAGKDWKK